LRPEQLASQFTIYQMACILAPEHTCSCSMRDFCSYLFSDTDGGVMEATLDAISIDSLERNSKGCTSLGDFILEQESSYMAQEKESELKRPLDYLDRMMIRLRHWQKLDSFYLIQKMV
jgi:hypothetical protein